MESRPRRRTLGEEAYDTLRQQILLGRLTPGSRLVVSVLAKELQTSATPINEALAALDRERLVSHSPHRGYSVSMVTPDMKDEIYTVRAAVEALAVGLAAKKADPATIEQLAAILDQASVAVQLDQAAVFSELDLAFHRTIWQASASPLVVRIAELVEGQIRLLVATGARAPGRMPCALAEHKRIYKAILGKKSKDAEAAMRTHIKNSKEMLKRTVPTGQETAAIDGESAEQASARKISASRKLGGAQVTTK
jgi:DNA-binding GntR family transcriptional regulator